MIEILLCFVLSKHTHYTILYTHYTILYFDYDEKLNFVLIEILFY